MKVVGKKHFDDFSRSHAAARPQIASWLYEVEEAVWQTPNDIKARYSNAGFLADNRVIFNIRGNRYRIDCKVSYKSQTVQVIRIGTHAEYDQWIF